MSGKRKRDADDVAQDPSRKKTKSPRGFRVGPDNLPDGAYKRKVQKIKSSLIAQAKVKKNYSKLKQEREDAERLDKLPARSSTEDAEDAQEASTAPHPDRQTLIDKAAEAPEDEETIPGQRPYKRRPKSTPFKREYEQAQQRKAEAEQRRAAREEAERQRQQKRDERQRFQKAMAKARSGGRNGQRKLGRESVVLLEKVKRLVGEGE